MWGIEYVLCNNLSTFLKMFSLYLSRLHQTRIQHSYASYFKSWKILGPTFSPLNLNFSKYYFNPSRVSNLKIILFLLALLNHALKHVEKWLGDFFWRIAICWPRVSTGGLRNVTLLPKLFWHVRKNCCSDQEKLLKFKAEGREFAKCLRSHFF